MVKLRFETDLGSTLKAHQDLAAATEKVGKGYEYSTKEARKLEVAAKRIVDQNLTPQERYNKKLEDLGRALRQGAIGFVTAQDQASRLRQKLTDLENAQNKTFGGKAIEQIAQYAQGFVTIGGLVAGVSQALRQLETDAQSAADATFAAFADFAALQQVSATPAEFGANVAFARSLVTRGIVDPKAQGQAAAITAGLIKQRLGPAELGAIADIAQTDIIKPDEIVGFAQGIQQFQRLFPGGTFRDVASQLIQAGQVAKATPGEVGQAATRFADTAKVAGVGGLEALATYVAVAQNAPNARAAATRTSQVFAGKRQLSADESRFRDQQLELLRTAGARDVVGGRGRFLDTDPALAAADLLQEAQGRLAIASERATSERENLFSTLIQNQAARAKERGDNVGALFIRFLGGIQDLFGGEESAFRREAINAARGTSVQPANVQEQVRNYLRRIAESNERMETGPTLPNASGRAE
jgi:hypothetical protein